MSDKILSIHIAQLHVHPKNNHYVKDIVGDEWQLFKDDIAHRGIIQPLLVMQSDQQELDNTEQYILISGHQRVRAVRELNADGIIDYQHVPCLQIEHTDLDQAEADLIRVNLMQRQYSIADRYRLATVLLDKEADQRKKTPDKRIRKADGTLGRSVQPIPPENGGLGGIEEIEKKESTARDRVAATVPGITKEDITILNQVKRLPEAEQLEFWAFLDQKNPRKKAIRDKVHVLESEISKLKADKKRIKRELNETKGKLQTEKQAQQTADTLRTFEIAKKDRQYWLDAEACKKWMEVLSNLRQYLLEQVGQLELLDITDETKRILHDMNEIKKSVNLLNKVRDMIVQKTAIEVEVVLPRGYEIPAEEMNNGN